MELIVEQQAGICSISLNRPDKHNAFDDVLLISLCDTLEQLKQDSSLRLIVLKGRGEHFSAGADMHWMRKMAGYSQAENLEDARILAKALALLYRSPVPTLAVVQGAAYGGGAGLVAACDMALCSTKARFCFSEVKLGLIPAVISPYVIEAIGARAAKQLFMTAEVFDAERAESLGLVWRSVEPHELDNAVQQFQNDFLRNAPEAIRACKTLVHSVAQRPIDSTLIEYTAREIAARRVTSEAQAGLKAFLDKSTPYWQEVRDAI